MSILFISRKRPSDYGGLSRFTNELSRRFPKTNYLLVVTSLRSWIAIPWKKIDLIHLCDLSLLPIGVMIKTIIHRPLTATVHGLDLVYPNNFYQKIIKFFSPKIHALIVDSPLLEKNLVNLPLTIKKEIVINPGISIDHLKKTEPFKIPINIKGKKVLLTVGNLVKRKGQFWFIKNVMTKLNKDYVYLIVGDGPERSRIQSLIRHMSLMSQISLIGQIDNQKLAWLYQQTDIYICPNQKIPHDFEGFGIAAGEATALGVPVIASRVDGLPKVIHDRKNGLIVDPTPEAFIKAIKKISQIKFIKNYTLKSLNWDKTIKEYSQVFKEVIDKTPLLPRKFL